jgi:hypothetical protein
VTSPLARPSRRFGCARRGRRGVVALLVIVAAVAILAIGSLALNASWLSGHKLELRRACEAAALAGAAQLLDPAPDAGDDEAAAARVAAATAQARAFFAANSSAVLKTGGPDPDVVAGWCADPTLPGQTLSAWTGAGPVNALFVRGVRRRSNGQAVGLLFGGLFSIHDAEPADAAVASMDQRVYGFRPVQFVTVPLVPLLAATTTVQWPSSVPAAAGDLPDNHSIDPHTRTVSAGPDSVPEITLRIPLAGGSLAADRVTGGWLLLGGDADYTAIPRQITAGVNSDDLAGLGGELALSAGGSLDVPAALTPDASQATALQAALLASRGQPRVWPLGSLSTGGSCQVTGFAAGCVVDCTVTADALEIVVQPCTIQTCTALLRSGTARNPWIGKLILNE